MKIAGTDTLVTDLTRWNRAGLDRFRYVDGGAAEWVEYLRLSHVLLYARNPGGTSHDDPATWRAAVETGRFEDGLSISDALAAIQTAWRQPAPWSFAEENADYRTALRAQYDHIPLDQTAQISRAFARAFHILTESLDAYANEGFLATATQAPHLRRLLEFIAFEPRLAASALVPIALSIVEDTPRQTIDRGLAVEFMPSDGTPILTFESMNALVVDPGINLMRGYGWDQRSDPIPPDHSSFDLADLSVLSISLEGTMALMRNGTQLQGAQVTAASKTAKTVTLERGPDSYAGSFQDTELLLAPTETRPVRPVGPTWLHFQAPPNVYVGQVLALSTDQSHADSFTWAQDYGAQIAEQGLLFDEKFLNEPQEKALIQPLPQDALLESAIPALNMIGDMVGLLLGDNVVVREVRGRDVRISSSVPSGLVAVYPAVRQAIAYPPDEEDEEKQYPVLGPYVTPEDAEPVGELEVLKIDRIYIDGPCPEGLETGSEITLKLDDGKVSAVAVESLVKTPDGFEFTTDLPTGYDFDDLVEIGMLFAAKSALVHEIRSEELLFPEDMNGLLEIEIDSGFDDLLRPGRELLLTPDPETACDDDKGRGMVLTIQTAARLDALLQLTFEEDLADVADFRRGYSVLYGNVAIFGHGKSLPEKVLGSGDGASTGQMMDLPAWDVATRPDPDFPGGAAPDIEITASGRKLRLVAREEDADKLQPSYLIRLTEDGEAQAVFLSRLPTDPDGVRLTRFRQGSGDAGNNVPPFSITKPTPKNPIIGAMIQPIAPQFGADVQDAAALKSQGNSHFALMDRALSARDFARLAESTTSIWHAYAGLVREAGSQGRPTIALTIVPAGGGSIEPVKEDLSNYLLARAMPGTVIDIRAFQPAPIKGQATVTLKKGYAQDVTILEDIQANLHAQFGLEARALGRTLFVTEITAAIEAHEAVENLVFTLIPDWPEVDAPQIATSASDAIQAVLPAPTQAVYFDAADDVEITWATGDAP